MQADFDQQVQVDEHQHQQGQTAERHDARLGRIMPRQTDVLAEADRNMRLTGGKKGVSRGEEGPQHQGREPGRGREKTP